MNTPKTPKRLTRAQITEGLDTVPISGLLGGSSRELTAKQKAFARAVAMGETGADAYRKAYKTQARPKLVGNQAHQLKRHPGIANEIEALKRAQEAEHLKNPAALRALVISTLVELATNPDAKEGTRLQAVKILGGVTEVAAFTERKETRVITSSEDARSRIMAELRALSNAGASDAQVIDAQADALLAEISSQDATHPPATAPNAWEESRADSHTIPLKQPPLDPENLHNDSPELSQDTPHPSQKE